MDSLYKDSHSFMLDVTIAALISSHFELSCLHDSTQIIYALIVRIKIMKDDNGKIISF
jgi:hypothetical protein